MFTLTSSSASSSKSTLQESRVLLLFDTIARSFGSSSLQTTYSRLDAITYLRIPDPSSVSLSDTYLFELRVYKMKPSFISLPSVSPIAIAKICYSLILSSSPCRNLVTFTWSNGSAEGSRQRVGSATLTRQRFSNFHNCNFCSSLVLVVPIDSY